MEDLIFVVGQLKIDVGFIPDGFKLVVSWSNARKRACEALLQLERLHKNTFAGRDRLSRPYEVRLEWNMTRFRVGLT